MSIRRIASSFSRALLAAGVLFLAAAAASAQDQVETFKYDAAGRLTRITYDGKTTISWAYDANGRVTSRSVTPTPPVELRSRSSSKGFCFIATAAYGSPLDAHVQQLREFRDEHLKTNAPGRAFVAFYERHSPPIAAFIADHDSLRALTRWMLAPLVLSVAFPKSALAVATLLVAALIAWRRKVRRLRARLAELAAQARASTTRSVS